MALMSKKIWDEEVAKAKAAAKTHIIVRVTADANRPYPDHAAYGPVSKAEAQEIMDASHMIFCNLNLIRHHGKDGTVFTAWRKGSSITWKIMIVELRPATDDVCEGIV